MRASSSLLVVVALVALSLASVASATWGPSRNLILNPSFEEGRSTPPYNITEFTDVPRWNISYGLSQSPPPYNGTATSSAEPGCIAHTGGFGFSLGAEVYPDNLTQTVATTPGTKYTLSFWLWSQVTYSDVQHDSYGEPVFIHSTVNKSLETCSNTYFNVMLNNVSITGLQPSKKTYKIPFAVAPYTKDFIPEGTKFKTLKFPTIPFSNADSFDWVQYHHCFKANATETTITFQGTNCGAHFSLDDVVLTADSHEDEGDHHHGHGRRK